MDAALYGYFNLTHQAAGKLNVRDNVRDSCHCVLVVLGAGGQQEMTLEGKCYPFDTET